jgi:hypothetical protein
MKLLGWFALQPLSQISATQHTQRERERARAKQRAIHVQYAQVNHWGGEDILLLPTGLVLALARVLRA